MVKKKDSKAEGGGEDVNYLFLFFLCSLHLRQVSSFPLCIPTLNLLIYRNESRDSADTQITSESQDMRETPIHCGINCQPHYCLSSGIKFHRSEM